MVSTCSVCPKMFPDGSSLRRHMRKHTGEKPYSCDQCDKSFSQSGSLKMHLRLHTGEKPYTCEICSKLFAQKGFFVIHMRSHTGEKPYQCLHCAMAFTHYAARKKHMRIHTGENSPLEKPFVCSECPKTFSSRTFLNIHFRTHTGEKPFSCTECPKTFTNKGNLLKHSEIHQAAGGEKPFLCYLCVKSFAFERYLKQHVMNVHKETYAVAGPRYHYSALLVENYVKMETNDMDELDFKTEADDMVQNVVKTEDNDMVGDNCINESHSPNENFSTTSDNIESSHNNERIKNELTDISKDNYSNENGQIRKGVIIKRVVQATPDHIEQIHDSDNGLKTKSDESLAPKVQHIESSQEGDTYDCDLCNFKKISKNHFSKHMASAHKKCQHCGYQSITKTDLELHTTYEHNESSEVIGNDTDVESEKPEEADIGFYQVRQDILNDMTNDRASDIIVNPDDYYTELYNDTENDSDAKSLGNDPDAKQPENDPKSEQSENDLDAKPYNCDYCPKSFTQHGTLLQHHLYVHKGKKWRI